MFINKKKNETINNEDGPANSKRMPAILSGGAGQDALLYHVDKD